MAHVDLDDANLAVESQAEELLTIDEALTSLAEHHPRLVKVFECKFFTGLDDDETAEVLGLSKRTAQRDWMKAKAFLGEHLAQR